jgi:Sulfotransferase domain
LPDLVIIGAQRSGTTSLHAWLCSHPKVAPFQIDEVHFFDGAKYNRGLRWYRAQLPMRVRFRCQVEASPYMLLHPLAPERAARDLPAESRFVALLREPVERALSHYWRNRKVGRENESFAEALKSEDERLRGSLDALRRGEASHAHRWFSYRTRGLYAEQLERWFGAVGRDRVMVIESERIFRDPQVSAGVLQWCGLPPSTVPYPSFNAIPRVATETAEAAAELRTWFEPHNEALFELLGCRLWEDAPSFR